MTPFFSRTLPLPTTTSQLRDGLLSDVLRYTLDRGVFVVIVVVIVLDNVINCGNDAERTASMLLPLLGIIVWEILRSEEAEDACVGEECSLPPLFGIVVVASSRSRRSPGPRQRGRTEIVRASSVPASGTDEASLNPQLGKREKKAQVKS